MLIFLKEIVSFLFQLKEFILSQAEAYEFKIGDQVFRRPGDPPLDQVLEKLQKEKSNKPKEELWIHLLDNLFRMCCSFVRSLPSIAVLHFYLFVTI